MSEIFLEDTLDPCREGQAKCVANSTCVREGGTFRCECNLGYLTRSVYLLTIIDYFNTYNISTDSIRCTVRNLDV